MGYYSNLAIDHDPCGPDHSYTPPEKQLLWRLEELKERLRELTGRETGKRDEGACFSEDNLRYVLPEHFWSAACVRKAIDLAISDLRQRYGIRVQEEAQKEPAAEDEVTNMQITFLDLLSLQSQRATAGTLCRR